MIVSIVRIGQEFCDLIERQTGEKVIVFNSEKEALGSLADAEILISWGRLGKDTLNACKNLKWLFSFSAGVEGLPFDLLAEKGVIVTNNRGIHGPQVAEHAIGYMIMFSRKLHRMIRNQLQRKWERIELNELMGKTLCIVGSGSIGKAVARRAKAFDMKVIGLKKHVETLEYFDAVWDMGRLHEALEQADYTILLTPLTPETRHMIGRTEFKAMKPTSVFINLSRGDTVDEEALIEALNSGVISGAGLDVFHEEPLPESNPLWGMENVIITPHNAGQSVNYIPRSMELFLESLSCYRQGQPIPNRIDLKKQY